MKVVQVIGKEGSRYYFSEIQWKERQNMGGYWANCSAIPMEVFEHRCESSPSTPCDCGELI